MSSPFRFQPLRRDGFVAPRDPARRRAFCLVVAAAALSGCHDEFPTSQVPPVATLLATPALRHETLEPEYRISPGDKLMISSYIEPALKQPVLVRPDGRVSLLLVGDVLVAGKTTDALRTELIGAYGRTRLQVDIAVVVTEVASWSVYVGGEVRLPSVQPMHGELTLFEAITAAGGFTNAANRQQVLILRPGTDGNFHAVQHDADAVLHNQTSEVYLRRHDIVYVPKSRIAKVDEFVDQYINQIIPHSATFIFGYQFLNQINGQSSVLVPQ